MNGIHQGLGIHPAPAATTLPHERRGDVPHAERLRNDATVLTLTTAASGSSAPSHLAPGLVQLHALLQGLRSAELAALPPRTAQLLADLGRHLLPVSDVGNASRVRNLLLASGLFAELPDEQDALAADAARPSHSPLDLKLLLGQLLALMQPGRQLTLRNGQLQFMSLNPGTAQCLQAYAEEQNQGPRQKSLQSRLLAQVESAFVGIVRNQLQSLALSSEKKTRWIMDLLVQHESGPLAVPVTLGHQAQTLPEVWEAEFELELRHCGPLHVAIGVKNSTVNVSIVAGRNATLEQLRGGKTLLAQLLARKGLTLGSYACLRGQHERTG